MITCREQGTSASGTCLGKRAAKPGLPLGSCKQAAAAEVLRRATTGAADGQGLAGALADGLVRGGEVLQRWEARMCIMCTRELNARRPLQGPVTVGQHRPRAVREPRPSTPPGAPWFHKPSTDGEADGWDLSQGAHALTEQIWTERHQPALSHLVTSSPSHQPLRSSRHAHDVC